MLSTLRGRSSCMFIFRALYILIVLLTFFCFLVWSGILDRLPNELIGYIMVEIFVGLDPKSRAFHNQRYILSLVSRFWLAMIQSLPELWKVLSVNYFVTTAYVRNFLKVVKTRRFTMAILCSRCLDGSNNMTDDWIYIHHALRLIIGSVSQWERFYISATYISTIQTLLSVFLNKHGNNLCHLFITYHKRSNIATNLPRSCVFLPHLPSLVSLTVVGVSLKWRTFPIGQNLSTLILSDFPRRMWPTFDKFIKMLLAAPNIIEMSICNMGCLHLPSPTSAPFILDRIQRLRIGLGGYGGVENFTYIMQFIQLLRFPVLQKLEVEARSEAAIAVFVSIPLFDHVRTVSLATRSNNVRSMVSIYAVLSSTVHLDLRYTTHSAVAALGCRVARQRVPVLPCLRDVSVRSIDHMWMEMHTAIRRRRSLCPVFNLTIVVYRMTSRLVIGDYQPHQYQVIRHIVLEIIWKKCPLPRPMFFPFRRYIA